MDMGARAQTPAIGSPADYIIIDVKFLLHKFTVTEAPPTGMGQAKNSESVGGLPK